MGMFNKEKINAINQKLQSEVDQGNIPGVNYLIAHKGEILHRAEIGFADIEAQKPMQPDSLFQIYSLTKPVTTFVILKLVEAGKLGLDDDVTKYIPEFKKLKVLTKDGLVNLDKPMTIRHLLTHRTGFKYPVGKDEISLKWYALYEKALKNEHFSTANWMAYLAEIPIDCQPGTSFTYGPSLDVLQVVFERISQTIMVDYVKENLFEPLGMKNTFYCIPKEKTDLFAKAYTWNSKEKALVKLPNWRYLRYLKRTNLLDGGEGLVSSVDDYLIFAQMILNGGMLNGVRVISEEMIDLMKTPQIPDGIEVPFLPGANFGFGFGVFTHSERHGFPVSKGEFCWSGYGHTTCWIDPARELIILHFAQKFPFGNPLLFTEFKKLVNEAILI